MFCARCDRDVAPVLDMIAVGQFAPRCPSCASLIKEPVDVVADAAPKATRAQPLQPAGDANAIVATMRRRLDEVRAQIRDTRRLEAEASRLERMIQAAEEEDYQDETMPNVQHVGRA